MRRAVFLDRDGVINRAIVREGRPHAPQTEKEFEILPDVPEALRQLSQAGFLLIVATNQPDVGRGLQKREIVEAMHRRLMNELPLHDIKVCYEIDGPANTCYKPKPGMLFAAAREYEINLTQSYMVGDRWRDVGCGRAAGCYTIFIDHGYAEFLRERPDRICQGLMQAVNMILNQETF